MYDFGTFLNNYPIYILTGMRPSIPLISSCQLLYLFVVKITQLQYYEVVFDIFRFLHLLVCFW